MDKETVSRMGYVNDEYTGDVPPENIDMVGIYVNGIKVPSEAKFDSAIQCVFDMIDLLEKEIFVLGVALALVYFIGFLFIVI